MMVANTPIGGSAKKIGDYYVDCAGDDLTVGNGCILVFSGFLYPDGPYVKEDLMDALIKDEGKTDLKRFRGKYCGVFVNTERGRACFFNDQLGLRDVFYYFHDGGFVVSDRFSEIMKLVKCETSDVNVEALKEFVVFEYPLLDKTFVRDVRILPLASVYLVEGRNLVKAQYWDYDLVEDLGFNQEKAIDKLDHLLDQSMRRIVGVHGKDKTFGLGLSGGMDSMVTAHYALKNGLKLRTFIFGEPGSDAYLVSRLIALKLGVEHKELGFDKDFVLYADELSAHDPMMNLLYAWYHAIHKRLPSFDVLLTGFNGDNQFGSHLFRETFANDAELSESLVRKYGIHREYLKDNDSVFRFVSQLRGSATSKWENFNYQFRQLKFVKNVPCFNFLSEYTGASLFEDIDVVEYLMSIPYIFKKNRKFYREFLKVRLPGLSAIRHERTPIFSNKVLSFIENALRYIDTEILQTNLIYRKSHKYFRGWLRRNDGFKEYCVRTIGGGNEFFSRVFPDIDLGHLAKRIYLGRASTKDIYLFFRALTVFTFIKTVDKKPV